MGVPALFRWLSKQYPKIVDDVKEAEPQKVDGVDLPLDTSSPNPNGVEFDNLYLDMNGIVHPCAHPENRPPPANEQEMMAEIFKYTERVVAMIRPRKLLFMAIDGVAPRAKMNQQRSRRFRAAQEAKAKDEDAANLLQELKDSGKQVSEDVEVTKTWDSNAITPGTPFMALLASSLRYWIAQKYATDPGWKNMKIILSDAAVPGEGEHKIMEFIRSQRASPSHDPNTQHVIYGLDADLIMLALGTHEPHFRVLREDVFAQDSNSKGCRICGQVGHYADQCTGKPKEKEGNFDEKARLTEKKPFIFLNVATLREYLEVELDIKRIPFAFDLERAIDDWVFLCFFVGNDFLPHLPSLEIREGAIDKLIAYWKKSLPLMTGYVTNDGNVNLERTQVIMDCLARDEDYIFKNRRDREERQEANNKRRKMDSEARMARNGNSYSNGQAAHSVPPRISQKAPIAPPADSVPDLVPLNRADVDAMEKKKKADKRQKERERQANMSAAARIKAELTAGDDEDKDKTSGTEDGALAEADIVQAAEDVALDQNAAASPKGAKRKAEELEDEASQDVAEDDDEAMDQTTPQPKKEEQEPAENEDTVRLWEPGFKERYYRQKFGVELEDTQFRRDVVKSYVEGLAWVLRYYFQGCPSWQWYYPYHYAPFASDFVDISSIEIKFNVGKPFKPYEQLMGVLPAASKHHLPKELNSLMTEEDSEILEYYPEDFPVDLNGKKFAWQGVVILPFIDEKRLLKAMQPRYDVLSEEDAARNEMGHDILYVRDGNKLYDVLCKLYGKRKSDVPIALDPRTSLGLIGSVQRDPSCVPRSTLYNPLNEYPELGDINDDASLSVYYYFPKTGFDHKSVLLKGVVMPSRVLTHADQEFVRNGGASRGGRGGGRGGRPDDSRGRTGRYMSERQDHSGWQNGNGNGYQGGYQGNGGQSNGGYQGNGSYQGGYGGSRGGDQSRSRGGYNGGYSGGGGRGGYQEQDFGRDSYSGRGSYGGGGGGGGDYDGGAGRGGAGGSGGYCGYSGDNAGRGANGGGYGSNRWDNGQYRSDNYGGGAGGGGYNDYPGRYEEGSYDNRRQTNGYGAGGGYGGYGGGGGYDAAPAFGGAPGGYGAPPANDYQSGATRGYGQDRSSGQSRGGGHNQRGYGNGGYSGRGYY